MKATKSMKFGFQVTNNFANYEALIAGLQLARKLSVGALKAYTDSELVVQQLKEEYKVKEPKLAK